jgi:hypothetical protein
MALDVVISGTSVNASGQTKIVPETDAATNPGNVGGVRIFSENDSGSLTGTPNLMSPETSHDFRLRVGTDTILLDDKFNATAQNTDKWFYIFATLTASQPGAGTLNFGTVQGTLATHGAIMRSWQTFPTTGTAPIAVEVTLAQVTAALVSNEVFRWGLGFAVTAGTAPTDGAWLELSTAGLIGYAYYNGVANPTGVLKTLAQLTVGDFDKFVMVAGQHRVVFWQDDLELGSLTKASGNGSMCLTPALPVFMQKACTGNVSNTNTMRVSEVTVSIQDIATNKNWADQAGTQGRNAYVGQNGGTMGQAAQWANTTLPTAAAGTNTTAALGAFPTGLFQLNAPATGTTDIIISSALNPAVGINATASTLMIKGVWIDCTNFVTAVATTATTFAVALYVGNTALTLATTETASFATNTTKAPRRIPLGTLYFPIAAPVGAGPQNGGIYRTFASAIPVYPGQYYGILVKPLIGTATATETFIFNIGMDIPME